MPANERVILITGASRGLGLELARCFARRQYRLVLTARDDTPLQAAAAELRQLTDVVILAGDVADVAHNEALVARGLARFGRLDVLINNASTIGPSPMPALDAYPLADLAAVFQVNVIAPLHMAQLVLPDMRARGSGVIINVSSDAGVNAYPGWGGYGGSKAALEHVSRTLAAELEGSGVRVYAVDPGDMNTRMHQEAEPGEDLSHLPGPDVPAPAFVYLVETETAPFLRVEAPALLAQTAGK
ncbi:MAG TPA: SDR family oxidoreductase [Chloroflexota bacterium]|jgi:NAD(P)-dependent dehydrogenase (short-subunit alcohol dehydrogenase family)|nr:SDR family oxidoreductase [Chloroflexota bacterium]